MPPAIPMRSTRTIAHVLLDIAEQHRICVRVQCTDAESAALDRLDELRAEAREMVEAATGVTYDHLAEAGL